jgi:squalene-hopene/tetraprenyl-beta-curcumene cyclase
MTGPHRVAALTVAATLGAVALAVGLIAHLPSVPAAAPPAGRLDAALQSARRFLASRQEADGAWRSDVYISFRDGASLTPLAALALHGLPGGPESREFRRASEYLVRFVRPDGSIDDGPHGLSYPVYTAALTVRVLSLPGNERFRPARDAWLADLRKRQLTAALGWSPDDPAYGGWGYCHAIPRKPKPGEYMPPLLESNLSATVFALDGLRTVGLRTDDLAYRPALVFIGRCQNFTDDPARADAAYDDGGFHFVYDDPARNKPGPAGRDRHGRERFRSYGSTTADGLRALRHCGFPADHPRVKAAVDWLRAHFDGAAHPGAYPPGREADKDAVYFYYAWSVVQSLDWVPRDEAGRWAAALAEGLLARQRPDGSWSNPCLAVREDDPVLATALAVAALRACQVYGR